MATSSQSQGHGGGRADAQSNGVCYGCVGQGEEHSGG